MVPFFRGPCRQEPTPDVHATRLCRRPQSLLLRRGLAASALVFATLGCSRSERPAERLDAAVSPSAPPVADAPAPDSALDGGDALAPLQGAWLERLELASGQV